MIKTTTTESGPRLTTDVPLVVPTSQATHITIEIGYWTGGVNWIDGKPEPRGIYLQFRPVHYHNGLPRWVLFVGYRALLETTRRKPTQKALERIFHRVKKEITLDRQGRLHDQFLEFAEKHGLCLTHQAIKI